jgi:hypothetical protein
LDQPDSIALLKITRTGSFTLYGDPAIVNL